MQVRKILLVISVICGAAPTAWPQLRPLRTDDAELLDVGRVRVEFGLEFLQNQRFSLSGLEGDLTRVGVAGIHVGVGEYAEFQISGVVQDFLSVSARATPAVPPNFAGNSTSDFGDLVLSTKLKLAREKAMRPAVAFKFAVQLPNANRESGLGADETEFFAGLLFSKRMGPARVLGNVGLAILGSPVLAGKQADLLTYGAGLIFPLHARISLVCEINGRDGPARERVGNEDQSQFRAGIQIHAAGLRWDLGGIAGLKRFDPDSGLAVGVTYEFKAFHK